MQIIERQAQLLRSLAHSSADGVSLRAVAKKHGWSPSSTHRLLRSLVRVGMVSQDQQTSTYRLGYEILSLAGAFLERVGLTELIDPYLETITKETGLVSFAAVRDADAVICTSVRVPKDATNFYVRVGRRLPLHASAGAKALIHDVERSRLRELLAEAVTSAFTEKTRQSVPDVLADLEAGEQHSCWFCDEEMEQGVWAAAAPIRSPAGRPVVSLSVLSLTALGQGAGSPVDVLTSTAASATREIGALLDSGQHRESS